MEPGGSPGRKWKWLSKTWLSKAGLSGGGEGHPQGGPRRLCVRGWGDTNGVSLEPGVEAWAVAGLGKLASLGNWGWGRGTSLLFLLALSL